MGNNYTDESMHTTSLKAERTKQRIAMLKAREEALILDRIELRRKQWVCEKIAEEFPEVRISIEKQKLMRLFEIVSIRENLRWTKI
jgi:hypothetical protein